MHLISTFSPVVITPTYNNAGTLKGILERVRLHDVPLIIVNDGSTDGTAEILRHWQTQPGVSVLTHSVNRGKAAALRTGFARAIAEGHTHALTIDTDGQLDPEQIPAFLAAAVADPRALILGARDETKADYPARSRLGRRVSNFLIRLECGLRVGDSQCGLRVYPLGLIQAVRCRANHFGFETEIISRAGWAGGRTADVAANCRYLPPGERVSHFRPWLDTVRCVALHGRLIARAVLPWPHRRSWADRSVAPAPLFRRMCSWLNPVAAWRQLRQDNVSRSNLAAGLAVGVFIANLPAYGLQTVLSLYAARRLHLHPLSVVTGSQLSTPPIGLALNAAAVCLGHFLLHGNWPMLADFTAQSLRAAAGNLLVEWAIGGVLIGMALAAITFISASFLFGLLRPAPAAVTTQ